jgi:hypothetical protein
MLCYDFALPHNALTLLIRISLLLSIILSILAPLSLLIVIALVYRSASSPLFVNIIPLLLNCFQLLNSCNLIFFAEHALDTGNRYTQSKIYIFLFQILKNGISSGRCLVLQRYCDNATLSYALSHNVLAKCGKDIAFKSYCF